jgi:hypothetical protein
MQQPLIQTRVPDVVIKRAQEHAAREGLTMAGWLRRLILKELGISATGKRLRP